MTREHDVVIIGEKTAAAMLYSIETALNAADFLRGLSLAGDDAEYAVDLMHSLGNVADELRILLKRRQKRRSGLLPGSVVCASRDRRLT